MGAPVRLSVNDPDLDWTVAARCRVFLDGVEIKCVESYDIEACTVTRPKRDRAGRIVIECDDVVIEAVRGHVEVDLLPA